ncbi:MAG: phosphatidate cytidylyltransferase [Pseudomonadota bacterium]|nr:MAG: phosphatidate cytidylyltransferase [Pseudomonadota bacterium]
MLKQRVVTAIALFAGLLGALFLLPSLGLAAVFGIVIALGAWEWAVVCGFAGTSQRIGYVLVLVFMGLLGIFWLYQHPPRIWWVVLLSLAWWVWVLLELIRHRARADGLFSGRSSKRIGGALVLLPPWLAAYYLHAHDPNSPNLLLFLLLLVGFADTFAFFTGHRFGRHKLAPQVSPGKTIEGLLGGVLAVLMLALAWGLWVNDSGGLHLFLWVALAVVVTLFSVVGDLAESRLKRLAGVKDSGTLLPGHGGILDRVDAFTAAAPVFLLGWIAMFQTPAGLP